MKVALTREYLGLDSDGTWMPKMVYGHEEDLHSTDCEVYHRNMHGAYAADGERQRFMIRADGADAAEESMVGEPFFVSK